MERRGSWLDSHGEDEGPGCRCWDPGLLVSARRGSRGLRLHEEEGDDGAERQDASLDDQQEHRYRYA